jgi:ribosomal-protein-alanine acetyltransferase
MATAAVRRIAIRPMTAADIRQVRRIERAAYGASTPGTPFEREIANGLAQYLVAVERDESPPEEQRVPVGPVRRLLHWLPGGGGTERIVGFVGVWFTVDQLHVVTVAVDPSAQHQGIAQRLLLEVYALATDAELSTIALEVRASNERARGLYEVFGFQRAGTLRSYYSDNGEDAIVMVTPALDTPDTLALLAHLRAEHARRYGATFVLRDE